MQKDEFLAAIQANPGNTRLRLMYADWLEERGNPMAAEWRQPVRHIRIAKEPSIRANGDGFCGHGDGDGSAPADGLGAGRYGDNNGDGWGLYELTWQSQHAECLRNPLEIAGALHQIYNPEATANEDEETGEQLSSYPYYQTRPTHIGRLTYPMSVTWTCIYLGSFLAAAMLFFRFSYQRTWESTEYVIPGIAILMILPGIGIWAAEACRSLRGGRLIAALTIVLLAATLMSLLLVIPGG